MPDDPTPGGRAVEGGQTAAKGAVKGAQAFLTKRTFGMPRWAFLVILAGGVGVGIWLRMRTPPEDLDEELYEEPLAYEDTLAAAEDPGLAGAGIIGVPPGADVIPVNAPTIPEGFTESFSGALSVVGELGGALADVAISNQDAQVSEPGSTNGGQTQPPQPIIINVPTGGGPPSSPPGRSQLNPRQNPILERRLAEALQGRTPGQKQAIRAAVKAAPAGQKQAAIRATVKTLPKPKAKK